MNKQRRILFLLLPLMMLISVSASAKTYKGTINIEVGETYHVELGYGSSYTVSGYWTKTGGNAFVITSSSSGNGGCTIKGNQVGTSTLNWTGVVSGGWSTWDEEFYWTVNVSPQTVPVTSIELNKTTLTMNVGDEEILTATVKPDNATNKDVWWISSDNNIAYVNYDGKVQARAVGNATITCKAQDGSGVVSNPCVVTVSDDIVAVIDETNFPDENFRNFVLRQDYGADGILRKSEISKINKFQPQNQNISDLKGVEFFTEIIMLACNGNQLTSLDLSSNTKLTTVYCQENELTSLNVTKNTALAWLYCSYNQLTSLDVTKNTVLTKLLCSNNQLATLDVSKNTALVDLYCENNQLTILNASKNLALAQLYCKNNKLATLNVGKTTTLKLLSCDHNQLTSLDVSNNTVLEEVECQYNNLTLLRVSNTGLKKLNIYDNQIKEDNMDILINGLPQNTSSQSSEFRVVDLSWGSAEGNKCTKTQVAAVKAKGWTPFFLEHGVWQEYEGVDDIISVKSITLNKTFLSLQTGQSETLAATVKPDNATNKTITWSSSDTSVATVDSNGKVTAVAAGNATITCTANDGSGAQATCAVTVTNPKPDKIVLPTEATITAGQTITLTPEVTPANAEYTLTWSSDDETVATVSQNGVVTGVKKGRTFINVETDNGKTAYCKLTVTALEPVSIELPKTATVYVGGTLTLTPTITPEGAETTLTWKSDDEAVVWVSTNGTLTGVAEGLALVTVSTSNGLTSNACKVTVEPDPSGISTVMMDEMAGVPVYSTSGQRLTAPRKGINIIGGKKVVIK